MTPETAFQTLLGAPLAAAAISALFFRRSRWGAPVLSLAAAGTILWVSLQLLLGWDGHEALHTSYTWFKLGDLEFKLGFLLDKTAAPMLFTVSFVAFFIHVFSIGYMDDDSARGRFFAGLSIFMFSIVGIVLADNLFMTFVFWELVGFSSYMLIAHYFDKDYAAAASKKAFITNRVGDLGFLLGILWCWSHYGTVDFQVLENAKLAGSGVPAAIGLLLMCGFIGKSAQFPLHVWLTDAMAGPTPVSALIHAATMVAAGVYLMVKLSVCGLFAPVALDVMLWSGAGLAALGGLCALGQTDIKKSLAYSTLSHLGFMGAAVGLGRPEIALLHMSMHAFFKATLFLCSGSVIHACHHEQDMTRMGGLLKKMPVTAAAFAISGLSICAFPYFAGWYSKDMILTAALVNGNYGAFALLAIAALGTALYIGRMFRLVFLGNANSDEAGHAHESNAWMTIPLVVLGIVFSLGAGWFLSGTHAAEGARMNGLFPASATEFLAHGYHELHHTAAEKGLVLPMLALGVIILVVGLGATLSFYKKTPGDDALRVKSPKLYAALERRWFDNAYDWYIANVQQRVAEFYAFFVDKFLLEGLTIRAIFAGIPAVGGILVRRFLFTGRMSDYAAFFVFGVILYFLYSVVL